MKRKLLTSFLAGMLAISGLIVAPGAETTNAQSLSEKKADNNAKRKQKQSELSKVRSEKTEVQDQIKQIDIQMEITTNEMVEKEEKITESRTEIKRLEAEIQEAEIRIAERDVLLKDRVRSMHVNGGAVNYLEVLLGSKSFGDFLDRVLALNVIAEQDRTIIEEQKADKMVLEENKEELNKLVISLEHRMNELKNLQSQLENQIAEKEKILDEIKDKEKEIENHMVSLEEEAAIIKASEEALKRERTRVRNNSSSTSGVPKVSSGMFTRPTEGRLTDGFHTRGGSHHGVDISKHGIVPVVAAADGTVSQAYYSNSYGYVVFIVHYIDGQKWETVYAHLRGLHVSAGQQVKKGKTVLGYQGNTGESRGQHLHFEIHKGSWNNAKSNDVNPCSYIRC